MIINDDFQMYQTIYGMRFLILILIFGVGGYYSIVGIKTIINFIKNEMKWRKINKEIKKDEHVDSIMLYDRIKTQLEKQEIKFPELRTTKKIGNIDSKENIIEVDDETKN